MDSFKCVGTVITDQGSKPKVLSRIAQNDGSSIETEDHLSDLER